MNTISRSPNEINLNSWVAFMKPYIKKNQKNQMSRFKFAS